jgi:hypothetical protein
MTDRMNRVKVEQAIPRLQICGLLTLKDDLRRS